MLKLEDSQIEAYRSDGVVMLRNLIDEQWRARLAEAIERDIENPGRFYHGYRDEAAGCFHANLRIWESDEDFRAYCLKSVLPELAAQFMGTDKVYLFYDQLFVKEPGNTNPTPWHHDLPYWPVKGDDVMSFWLALDPVTHESGALEFIKGSHRWDKRYKVPSFTPDTYELGPSEYLDELPDINGHRDQYAIDSWEMQPGDVLAFHGLLLHGAPGNSRSDLRRRGYTVRYAAGNVTYDPHPAAFPSLRCRELRAGEPLESAQFPVTYTRPAD